MILNFSAKSLRIWTDKYFFFIYFKKPHVLFSERYGYTKGAKKIGFIYVDFGKRKLYEC